jgi:hypothetical protein
MAQYLVGTVLLIEANSGAKADEIAISLAEAIKARHREIKSWAFMESNASDYEPLQPVNEIIGYGADDILDEYNRAVAIRALETA